MSWTARVRDNAMTRLKKAPVSSLPWSNPAATMTGHFRPSYGTHEDQQDTTRHLVVDEPSSTTTIKEKNDCGVVDADVVAAPTTATSSFISTVRPAGSTDALAWMNAEDMDPFIGHEREVANALQGIRRSMDRFLNVELKGIIYVKIPAAPPLLTNPELSAPSPVEAEEIAAAVTSSKKPPKPPKGATPKPHGETPSGLSPGSATAACNALVANSLTSAHSYSLSLEKAQQLLHRLEETVAAGAIRVFRQDAGDAMNQTNPSRSKATTPQPTTARSQPKRGGAMTPHETASPHAEDGVLVHVPDRLLTELKVFVKEVAHVVRAYDDGIHALAAHYKLSNGTSEDEAKSAALPTLGSHKVVPCHLSKGLSMAARELALHQSDGGNRVKGSVSVRRTLVGSPPRQQQYDTEAGAGEGFGSLSDPDVVASCTDAPSCGEYLVGCTVNMFGRCSDMSHLTAHVICGHWTPRETVLLWILKCLQEFGTSERRTPQDTAEEDCKKSLASSKSLLALLPHKVSIGVGWQRHPVHGAVTVCLATPTFVELPFTTQHSLLPIGEISRYVTNGLASRADMTQFPIQFTSLVHVAEFKAIRALVPTSHPIEPQLSSEIQLLLDVPLTVDIACTVVQVDAPPQTPFYGRKVVDAEMKLARRKGKPLASVPQEPRCSTSSCLVDFPPSTLGTVTRVTVRLVSHCNATLHIFAKLNGQSDASFHKVSSVQIQPAYSEELWFAAQGVASNPLNTIGLPVTSEMFQRWRGCVVAPLCDTLLDGAAMVPFEVFLPNDTRVCVLKGAHGETTLRPTPQHSKVPQLLPHSTPSFSSANLSIGAMSPIPQDSETSVGERPLLPPLPVGTRTSSSQRMMTDVTGTSSATSSDSLLKKRRGGSRANTMLFRGVLHRAKEGPLQLWADGFVVCQWAVTY
jgi:hypothetical protein